MKFVLVTLAMFAGCRHAATNGPDAASDGAESRDGALEDAPGGLIDGARDAPADAPEPCGNGTLDPGEACDDGNRIATDGCTATCTIAMCGDGVLHAGVEGCDDGNVADGDGCDPSCQPGPLPLRIVAGNLTSGNFQSYDLGHGQRIFQGLHADVALVQELNIGDGSEAALRGFVDTTFGTSYAVFREPGDLPNAVVSRFPIVESGVEDDPRVSNRELVWARLDLPNTSRDLWVFSLHLLTTASERPPEADALVAFIQRKVPAADFLVIGGDLNTTSRTESAMGKLGAVVVATAPFPADQNSNDNTNSNRSRPHDWVMVDSDLTPYQVASAFGARTFAHGIVFDSRLFTQAELDAAAPPILVGDSGAPSMQHMAVVKDFVVPVL